jgi:hypothetical protein
VVLFLGWADLSTARLSDEAGYTWCSHPWLVDHKVIRPGWFIVHSCIRLVYHKVVRPGSPGRFTVWFLASCGASSRYEADTMCLKIPEGMQCPANHIPLWFSAHAKQYLIRDVRARRFVVVSLACKHRHGINRAQK